MVPGFLVLMVASLGALLFGEATGRSWKLVPKMVLSSGFVLVALDHGALESTYGRWILTALILSWIGDLLLGIDRAFLAGLVSFAIAHLAYIAAFVRFGASHTVVVFAGIAVLVVGVVVLRWLRPHLSTTMAPAVTLYVLIIGSMLSAAFGTRQPGLWVPVAMFAVSDVAVARHRFVDPGFINKLLGLPLYFLAQFVLATTVAVEPVLGFR
ncbi:MAG: lysoplasmalogenase [Acidimicrobiia bacterium]|nr:lysoplasmalogenase [Acidimicrobiia bacterium]